MSIDEDREEHEERDEDALDDVAGGPVSDWTLMRTARMGADSTFVASELSARRQLRILG
jgi:hypothetical protein